MVTGTYPVAGRMRVCITHTTMVVCVMQTRIRPATGYVPVTIRQPIFGNLIPFKMELKTIICYGGWKTFSICIIRVMKMKEALWTIMASMNTLQMAPGPRM